MSLSGYNITVSEKVCKLLKYLEDIIARRKTGCLEINISQGGVTTVYFKEKLDA